MRVSLYSTVNNKIKVPPGAEELVGRAVEHLFEKEDGEKNEWRGMVLSRAPIMTHWYYITYEKDPVLYMYQLWDDYKDGDLRVLPESGIEVRICVWSIHCACMFNFNLTLFKIYLGLIRINKNKSLSKCALIPQTYTFIYKTTTFEVKDTVVSLYITGSFFICSFFFLSF